MTQEEKELLFKDLCARLPYGVKVEHLLHSPNNPSELFGVDVDKQVLYCDHKGREEWYKVDFIKPYLRSMSSMTEEERKEYLNACDTETDNALPSPRYSGIDWLNAHHFDFRGLLDKGLAIEVTESNNPYK